MPDALTTLRIMRDSSLSSEESSFVWASIQEVYSQTGEDLVRSGLLANYAKYENRWVYNIWIEDKQGDLINSYRNYDWTQPNGKGLKNYIPQDIDHYTRSVLWRNSIKIFKLRAESQPINPSTSVKATKVEKEIPTYVPQPFPKASKWRRIYEVVDTVTLGPQDLEGQSILVEIESGDSSEYIAAEAKRIAFNRGAMRVRIEVSDPAQPIE